MTDWNEHKIKETFRLKTTQCRHLERTLDIVCLVELHDSNRKNIILGFGFEELTKFKKWKTECLPVDGSVLETDDSFSLKVYS